MNFEIPVVVKKNINNNLVVAIVKAKDWYKNSIIHVSYPVEGEDFVVCKWYDFHDGLKSNIEGKQTIAICRNKKDAELLFNTNNE